VTNAPTAPQRLAAAALEWYATNGRPLAFRRTSEPWAVLVAEVMAQQTQAERAAEAWSIFIERYPTPAALAAASAAEVIRAWRGLGYNRRAVALRSAAIRIVQDHQGEVPDSIETLTALPGVGPYTARAVLATAFGRPVAALDTNVRRVLERALGPLPSAAADLQSTADGFVPVARPAAWTHALMDVGARFCRKRTPHCAECPLVAHCGFSTVEGHEAWVRLAPPASARRAPATRASATLQPAFRSTSRWLRGRILDRLRDAPDGRWVTFDRPVGQHDRAAVERALAALALEELLERDPAEPARARLAAG
jgi:A/G-specific adenine glycosylase